jgi:putative transposase
MTNRLREAGFKVGRYPARRLMRMLGLMVKPKCKFKVTTDSKHRLSVAGNVLDWAFSPPPPNRAWASDFTYLWTQEGWVCLAVVSDFYARRVVGWSMDRRVTKSLVIRALLTMINLNTTPIVVVSTQVGLTRSCSGSTAWSVA